MIRRSSPLASVIAKFNVAWCVLAATAAMAQVELELPPEPLPDDLLSLQPFDRLILNDGKVVDIVPLPKPRPMERQFPAYKLSIERMEGSPREAVYQMKQIRQLIYWENLLLNKATDLTRKKQFDRAFPYFIELHHRDPQWPGFQEQFQDYLFQEAHHLMFKDQEQRAMLLLRELQGRNPEYENLDRRMGRVVDHAARRLSEITHFAEARAFVRQLKKYSPNNEMVKTWEERFRKQAQELADEAVALEQNGQLPEASLKTRHMVQLWPQLAVADEIYGRILKKYPYLIVGVGELPRDVSALATPRHPEMRVARLLHLPLLELNSLQEGGQYSSRLVKMKEFRKTELGRGLTLVLAQNVRWSDGDLVVTGLDVARTITWAAEHSPRWAGLLQSVRNPSTFEININLSRSLVSPEWLLLMNVLPNHRLRGDRIEPPDPEHPGTVGAGPYLVHSMTDDEIVFRANPKYVSTSEPIIQEIIERRYQTSEAALADLKRGKVSLVEQVPPHLRSQVQDAAGVELGKYQAPATHYILVDGRKMELRNRTLRRALVYAINREQLLKEEILRDLPSDTADRVLAGLFVVGHYAHNNRIKPRPYNPYVARTLAGAAQTELGRQSISLRLHYSPDDLIKTMCEHIAARWRRIGLQIELIEVDPVKQEHRIATGQSFDLYYRIHRFNEPATDLAHLLGADLRSAAERVPTPAVASPWLRQLLVRLENTPDWPTYRSLLQQVDQVVHDDVTIIPLWQLAEHFAYRPHIRGFNEYPLHLYHNVQEWVVDPWYPKDPS